MAPRAAILLLLALGLCSYAVAMGEDAQDCCLSTTTKPIPLRILKSFRIQTANGGCRIPAIQFITLKNLKLCAPLPVENDWVARLIQGLKRKQKRTPTVSHT